ncbi:unnamed protein product [Phytomonas sp. EM1]|nr:unnamed protein product [Phytomonas sp. EM1]|eukprot:CCW60297.1 unnamed protein product [Phytomonas sp. isolate EM1]
MHINPPKKITRYIAVDLEFLKCRGLHFARSIAFVPFEARKHGAGSSSSSTERACTWFTEVPTVLAIESNEVMRTADVLPCGHLLYPYLKEHLVHSEALEELKNAFRRESEASLEAYRNMRHALREVKHLQESNRLDQAKESGIGTIEKEACTEVEPHDVPLNGIEDSMSCAASELTSSSSLNSNGSPNEQSGFDDLQFPLCTQEVGNRSLSPTEVELRRRLQIRAAISYHFELLDPYTIPNIYLLGEDPLKRLYTDPTNSSTFAEAVKYVSRIRAYGRGKGKHKALAFLFHYYPEFTQAVLRESFPNATDWCDFLRGCAELVKGELRCVEDTYRRRKYPFTVSPLCIPTAVSAPLYYNECASLEDFSAALNKAWSHFLFQAKASKFYAYGSMDAKVLSTTLRLSCDEYRQMRRPRTKSSFSQTDISQSTQTTPMPYFRKDVLLSPFQAKLVDITKSTLFSGAGFIRVEKMIPGLPEALQRVASCDSTAKAVSSIQRPHDPLWDAQALACVCVGAGVVGSADSSKINSSNKAANKANTKENN